MLVDPRQLGHYGVTLQQVEDAISKSNANIGGDILTLGSQSHNVRGIGLLGKGKTHWTRRTVDREPRSRTKLEDIGNVVITQYQGTPIYVRNVAKVVEGHRPRLGIIGRERGRIGKRRGPGHRPDAEVREVTGGVRAAEEKIKEIQKRKLLPPGMKIRIFNQRTELVHVTTHNVRHNLLMGMGLVVAILFVFLGDIAAQRSWRS